MKILSAVADCHCMTVQGEKVPLAPGESGTLEIVLDTLGLPLGAIAKKVTVAFSDSNDAAVLDLRVKNQPNFTIEPESVDFGSLTKGKPVERVIRITNESGRSVKFLASSKTESQLTVLMDKTEVAAGGVVTVTMRCNPAVAGEFLDILILRTALEAEPLINIPVRGKVIS